MAYVEGVLLIEMTTERIGQHSTVFAVSEIHGPISSSDLPMISRCTSLEPPKIESLR